MLSIIIVERCEHKSRCKCLEDILRVIFHYGSYDHDREAVRESGEGRTECGCRFKKLLHGEAGDFPLKLILNAHQLIETMVSQKK